MNFYLLQWFPNLPGCLFFGCLGFFFLFFPASILMTLILPLPDPNSAAHGWSLLASGRERPLAWRMLSQQQCCLPCQPCPYTLAGRSTLLGRAERVPRPSKSRGPCWVGKGDLAWSGKLRHLWKVVCCHLGPCSRCGQVLPSTSVGIKCWLNLYKVSASNFSSPLTIKKKRMG